MAGTNKYEPLGKFLAGSNQKRVRISFAELDALCSLPRTAYVDRPFWANTWQSQRAKVWLGTGYVVDEIDLGNSIVFRRDPKRAKDPGAGRKNSASARRTVRNRKKTPDKPAAKSGTQPEILRPCPQEVERYLRSWETLESYSAQEQALDELFTRHCPENRSLTDVLIKVSLVNSVYSTNIYSLVPVAQHILALDIDPRLSAGDLTVVGDIQKVTIGGKERNFYSFASKYCGHHAPETFPVYDRNVEKMLCYFRDADGLLDFRDSELKEYPSFHRIFQQFRTAYGLTGYSLRDVSKYLWQMGKKHFPHPRGGRE